LKILIAGLGSIGRRHFRNLIALGQTHSEALNITAMAVKAAEIFAGACMVGEPVFMSQADIMHIYQRPDEIYRRQQFVE